MLFVIYCLDKPDVQKQRAAAMQPHKDYVATRPIKVVMSGPLTTDDGERVIGSLFLVEAADRSEVEAFQRNDPLYRADIWSSVEVRAYAKRVDNRD